VTAMRDPPRGTGDYRVKDTNRAARAHSGKGSMRDHRQQPDGRLEARALRPRSGPSSAGSASALGPAEIKRLQRLAGNSAVLQRDKGSPTPAPAAPPKAPPQPTDEERAVALQKELQPIFKKIFGKYGATEHFAPRGIKILCG